MMVALLTVTAFAAVTASQMTRRAAGTVTISPASGTDISAAIAEAAPAAGDNIVINLADGGEYTITSSIVPSANITINGNDATIDASGLTAAFINYTNVFGETIKKADGSDSGYKEVGEVTIDGVTISGLGKALVNNGAGKVLFDKVTVSSYRVQRQ